MFKTKGILKTEASLRGPEDNLAMLNYQRENISDHF